MKAEDVNVTILYKATVDDVGFSEVLYKWTESGETKYACTRLRELTIAGPQGSSLQAQLFVARMRRYGEETSDG